MFAVFFGLLLKKKKNQNQGYSVKKCIVCLTIEVILLGWNLVSPLSLLFFLLFLALFVFVV